MVTAEDVKRLREQSGAGVMDCKRALDEAGGNIDKAVELLREKGIAGAEHKAHRETSQGLVETYIHAGKVHRAIRTCPRNRFDRPRKAVRRTIGTMTIAKIVWVTSEGK